MLGDDFKECSRILAWLICVPSKGSWTASKEPVTVYYLLKGIALIYTTSAPLTPTVSSKLVTLALVLMSGRLRGSFEDNLDSLSTQWVDWGHLQKGLLAILGVPES